MEEAVKHMQEMNELEEKLIDVLHPKKAHDKEMTRKDSDGTEFQDFDKTQNGKDVISTEEESHNKREENSEKEILEKDAYNEGILDNKEKSDEETPETNERETLKNEESNEKVLGNEEETSNNIENGEK